MGNMVDSPLIMIQNGGAFDPVCEQRQYRIILVFVGGLQDVVGETLI